MKDTSEFYAFQSYLVDSFMSPKDRLNLARSWGSVLSLLPKGGEDIWGDLNGSPDDIKKRRDSGLGVMFSMKEKDGTWNNLTSSQSLSKLFSSIKDTENGERVVKNFLDWNSFGMSKPDTGFNKIKEREIFYLKDGTYSYFLKQESKYWSNPLESPLPYAPKMKIYCMYGIGKKTERGYIYSRNTLNSTLIPYNLHTSYANEIEDISSGVKVGEGDGTVPLMSLGFMCVKGWKNDFYNPAKIKVITREYKDLPSQNMFSLRGGPETGDHVDILGNVGLVLDILSIITGKDDADKEIIHSKIVE